MEIANFKNGQVEVVFTEWMHCTGQFNIPIEIVNFADQFPLHF